MIEDRRTTLIGFVWNALGRLRSQGGAKLMRRDYTLACRICACAWLQRTVHAIGFQIPQNYL